MVGRLLKCFVLRIHDPNQESFRFRWELQLVLRDNSLWTIEGDAIQIQVAQVIN